MSEPDAPPPWAAALTSTLQQVVEEQSALRQRLDELVARRRRRRRRRPAPGSPAACRQSMGDQLPAKPAIESSLGHEDQDEEVFDAANRLSAAQGKPVSPAKKEAGAHERRTTTTTLTPTADLLMQDKELHTLITQDKAFERILDHLKTTQVQHELRQKRMQLAWMPTLHPDGRFRSRWDLTLAIVLLFVCFVVPIRVAFPENFVSVQIAWLVVDSIFDSLFIIDLLLNFITGFAKDGTVVMEPVPIMKHYLATWFLLDLISSFPLDLIFFLAGGGFEGSTSLPPEVLRLNKIFRNCSSSSASCARRRCSPRCSRAPSSTRASCASPSSSPASSWPSTGSGSVTEGWRRATLMVDLQTGQPTAAYDDYGIEYVTGFYWAW